MARRGAGLREIETLDPVRDYERVTYITGGIDFPFDVEVALELALFRTYGVPSISKVLAATGEFEQRGQRRVDDTMLILSEILQGPDTARGAAVRQLNRIHAAYDISNDDHLYTLSTFVVMPTRWIERFGWRALTEPELRATVTMYRRVGQLMNIRGMPDDYAGFERLLDAYERAHFRYAETNHRVALATLRVFESRVPEAARAWVRTAALALIDDPLLDALGLPRSPPAVRAAVEGALRARARVLRFLPTRERSAQVAPSYPHGWSIDELGPAHARRCPHRP